MKKRILSAVIVLVTCLALLPAHAASMKGAGGVGNSFCLHKVTNGRINSGKTRVCGACRGSLAADKTNTGFTDVKKGAFYEKAVAWAVEADVTTGTIPTAFSPNAACTRAQTVTFLYRLVKNMN